MLAGHSVLFTTAAQRELANAFNAEAVIWCEPARLGEVMSALEADPRVIAIEALVEMPDSEPPDPA